MTTLRIDKTNVDNIIRQLKENGLVIPMISDPIFKSVFKDKQMKGILSFVISEVTGLSKNYVYDNMNFRDTNIEKKNITHKSSSVDLMVDIEKNIIMLEMNAENTMYNRFRNVSHFHSQIVNNILVSTSSQDVGQIYQINFDNKKGFSNKLISRIMMRDDDNKVDEDEVSFQKFKINLSFLQKKSYNITELTRFEKILLIMREDNKKRLKDLAKGDKELEIMVKKIINMSENPKYVSLYDEEKLDKIAREFEREEFKKEGLEEGIKQGIKEGRKEGRKEGIIEGLKEGKRQTAKKMLNKSISIDDIIEITGLSRKEIENL